MEDNFKALDLEGLKRAKIIKIGDKQYFGMSTEDFLGKFGAELKPHQVEHIKKWQAEGKTA